MLTSPRHLYHTHCWPSVVPCLATTSVLCKSHNTPQNCCQCRRWWWCLTVAVWQFFTAVQWQLQEYGGSGGLGWPAEQQQCSMRCSFSSLRSHLCCPVQSWWLMSWGQQKWTHTHTRIHTSLTLNVRTVVAVAELYNSREESAQQLDDRLDRREE